MSYEVIHFRKAQQILKKKKMMTDLNQTLQYVDDVLCGAQYRSELFREALGEMNWRNEGESLAIFEGRRYQYKGLRNKVAIEGSFAAYEYLIEGLARLQLGFDKKKVDCGILLLTSLRSEKTPYGSTKEMATKEIEEFLFPTINLPVTLVLYDLGKLHINKEEAEIPKAEGEQPVVEKTAAPKGVEE